MLNRFDPKTFPNAMSDCFRNAATTDVANSGIEVPAAMIVKPITASETPNDFATSTALSTSNLDPNTSTPSPATINTTSKNKLPRFRISGASAAISTCAASSRLAIRIVHHVQKIAPTKNTEPSTRLTCPSKNVSGASKVTPNKTGASHFNTCKCVEIGNTTAANPRMIAMLKMFDPTTFPIAMSG